MKTEIVSGDIPFGIYEGIMSAYTLQIDGTKESALEDADYVAQLSEGIRGINFPVIACVKNNNEGNKIIELTFKSK